MLNSSGSVATDPDELAFFRFSIQNLGEFSNSISNSPVLPGHNTSGHPIGHSGKQELPGRSIAYHNMQMLSDTVGILNMAAEMVLPERRRQPRKTRSVAPNIREAIRASSRVRVAPNIRGAIRASSRAHRVLAHDRVRLHSKSLL